MKIAALKEHRDGETRAAISPEVVKKLRDLDLSVTVQRGIGEGAHIPDAHYEEAGAALADSPAETLEGADVVLKVRRPAEDELKLMPEGAVLIGLLDPHNDSQGPKAYADQKVTAFTMELLPRITRAQTMDVLSSQSNLAGYKAVIDAAATYGQALPQMMTAAGTIAPARVFVMGAGVAGLQAIATAKRLGARVSATDVRPAAKEQVHSLGASFVMVETEETRAAETEGGYAREMSEDYKRQQAELIAETVPKQDIVITTALIPGRKAPVLVTEEMVKAMRPGSVIVDMAVEQGGNCALSKPGEVTEAHGVTIIGHKNMPGRLAADSSRLYARNLFNFLKPLIDEESKTLRFDWEDEILTSTCLAREGQAVHPDFGGTPIEPPPAAESESSSTTASEASS
ncbi:MAG: Re/Si-specific NAD(P)(+) transhydrogenase subunit alpha [Alphaproteobacteria bacterium]